jgi:hypothetical protein
MDPFRNASVCPRLWCSLRRPEGAAVVEGGCLYRRKRGLEALFAVIVTVLAVGLVSRKVTSLVTLRDAESDL